MEVLDAILSEYRLQDEDRGLVGPVGLETVFDLLDAGVVTQSVQVSRDEGPFEPLSAFNEFRDHLRTETVAKPTAAWQLSSKSVIRLLFELYCEKSTGLVVVQDGELRKDIYARNGELVFLSSNIPSERFGQFLTNRGRLDEHDMKVALSSMHTDNNRFGETLLRLGLLEEEELAAELREHHLERLIELCCWSTGGSEYFDGMEFEGAAFDMELTVPELVLRAVHEMPEQMLAPLLEASMGSVPKLTDADALEPFRFSELEWRIVDKVNGTRTLGEIVATYEADTEPRRVTLAILYLLVALDLVTLRDAG